MPNADRSTPGARWWKFDLHTHTPASSDTGAWQRAKGTPEEVTPDKWLLKFMAAEIDCVAVTDHNSGAWIDPLKSAYAAMRAEADRGEPRPGYQPLVVFPGVEISVNGGVHILAIFDPSKSTSDIDTLLGRVGYQGTRGNSDGVTQMGIDAVIREIVSAGAIPIPAHADRAKGLLELGEGRKSKIDQNTLLLALDVEGLLAVEWCDPSNRPPAGAESPAARLSRVLGSDCHSFQDQSAPGKKYTWVKFAQPDIEGLRLALLDGNGTSLRRSDDDTRFDPNPVAAHTLVAIEIRDARLMGQGRPARVELSSYFNAIVGGRGTGKSTVVHALRLVCNRGAEFVESSEPSVQFREFCKVAKGRTGQGALRESSKLIVEWLSGGALFRLVWRAEDGRSEVQEWCDGNWVPTPSQAVNAARFPLRIFSQGQIASITGGGRRSLLAIVDESAGVERLRTELEEARRVFFEQRARLRTIDGKLRLLPEVERKFDEAGRKKDAIAQSNQAAVLHDYARTSGQWREVKTTFDQAREAASRLDVCADELLIDDWSTQHFDSESRDIVEWRADVDAALEAMRNRLRAAAHDLRAEVESWNADPRIGAFRARVKAAGQAHEALQQQLREKGVKDPGEFERVIREWQVLEQEKKELMRLRADREALLETIVRQRELIRERREAIARMREAFIERVLLGNQHVRITVVPYGFDSRQIERELRELIGIDDGRFGDDILRVEDGEERGGIAYDLAGAAEKAAALERVQRQLGEGDASFSGHFRNYLKKSRERPEFMDHILAWSPEDDIRIEYCRNQTWIPIEQGSQGQRAAALLAFLLSFGDEPIVLDQPEDDLDNHLIYDLIVQQIRANKQRRQLIIVTHNPNVVVNGDAELVHVMDFLSGQCVVKLSGALQQGSVRQEVCKVMEGGHEAFARRWKRLGREI